MLQRNISLPRRSRNMPNLRESLAQLTILRRKFESLLAGAKAKSPRQGAGATSSGLRELTGFGSNPGNLRMFVHAPDRLPSRPGLVVALHGCTQTADDFDYGTGWSTLANRQGFVVVYPQQQPANNAKNCFSWFLPADIERDHGEARSIREMIEHAVVSFGLDRRRVFVTGLSAGGAMASVMLATYPEVFAGGAILAGLPYGCAQSVQQAFEVMFAERSPSERALGDCVRSASKHQGPWPRISVWHGTDDPIVRPSNAEDIIRQWTNVHALKAHPTREERFAGHRRRIWSDASGKTLLEAVSINGMAHGVPIASALGAESCGAPGPFFLEVGISSTHEIASFWGMGERWADAGIQSTVGSPQATCPTTEFTEMARNIASSELPRQSDGGIGADGADGTAEWNATIAAAFKAASLPIPEVSSPKSRAPSRVRPDLIIEAALRAAGLIRR
jgi:poly(hydroxyalkanoate) depolymerase family esterase